MPPRKEGTTRSFSFLLWTAIFSLAVLLVLALWSYVTGILAVTDAVAVAGFVGVMIIVLAWASLYSRKTPDKDGQAAPSRGKHG